MTPTGGATRVTPAMQSSDRFDEVVDKLCASSRRHYTNPYEGLEWPDELDRGRWFMSPELISIYGTEAWEALSEPQAKELSFWEAVNFFSLNIHGEKSLMEGLARRLYAAGGKPVSPYLHHMLDEENKHSVYFGGFCTRYAGKVYPERKLALAGDPEGAEDFLFFAKVLIFEEIVDRYNVAMSADRRLHPIARFINENHHLEETRHLAFGRGMVKRLFDEGRDRWPAELLDTVRHYLAGYLQVTWKEYYNPAVYADAGLPEPWSLAAAAHASPAARSHRRTITGRCLRFLRQAEILVQEPIL
jgi:hypothetical protein